MTGVGDWMVASILLFLRQYCIEAITQGGIISNRKGLWKTTKASTGAVMHLNLSSWNATTAAGGSHMKQLFSLLLMPDSRSLRDLAMLAYPLMKGWK